MKDTFTLCPERTVQWRPLSNTGGAPSALWRTARCNADRWHYTFNPCNCQGPGGDRPPLWSYIALGYALEFVAPETGTWRRDAQHIANVTRTFREQVRQQRELETVARAAVGPRNPGLYMQNLRNAWLAFGAALDPAYWP